MGLQFYNTSSRGATYYRIKNTFSSKMHVRKNRAASVTLYEKLAEQMNPDGRYFTLTPSERAA